MNERSLGANLRVFLADDHAVVREGLKALINAEPGITIVGEASDGLTACERVPTLKPDVVVMDVSMPGLSGSQATERLRRECPEVKVIALTVHEDKGYIRQLLAAGAVGYVSTRTAREELILAIRVVAAGEFIWTHEWLAKSWAGSCDVAPTLRKPVGAVLSEREVEVARLTAAGHSHKEIASRLEVGIKTVETYRARAMEKLGLKSRAELVRYAFQKGWLQDG